MPDKYPKHWADDGRPPYPFAGKLDHRQLPGGYGHGTSTVAQWILENMELDEAELKIRMEKAELDAAQYLQKCQELDQTTKDTMIKLVYAGHEDFDVNIKACIDYSNNFDEIILRLA